MKRGGLVSGARASGQAGGRAGGRAGGGRGGRARSARTRGQVTGFSFSRSARIHFAKQARQKVAGHTSQETGRSTGQ